MKNTMCEYWRNVDKRRSLQLNAPVRAHRREWIHPFRCMLFLADVVWDSNEIYNNDFQRGDSPLKPLVNDSGNGQIIRSLQFVFTTAFNENLFHEC